MRLDAVIVVAGMEGALASVLGGLVAARDRRTHLHRIRRGIGRGDRVARDDDRVRRRLTVVNIDSGFGAAMAAHRLSLLRDSAPATQLCSATVRPLSKRY